MRTYIAQVDVEGETVQNPQEFITAWGTIREDVEVLGGEILDTYALLGENDFHVLFRVEDTETALQVTQLIEKWREHENIFRSNLSSPIAIRI